MSRREQNFYIPADFDPAKLPKRTRTKQFEIRMMMPFGGQCLVCGEFIPRGKKFNSKLEKIEGETYLGVEIFRFIGKCMQCSSLFSFKTDPKTLNFIPEHGITRNFETWRDHDNAGGAELSAMEKKKLEEEQDKMRGLENRTLESKRQMEMLDALDDLRAHKASQAQLLGDPDALLAAVVDMWHDDGEGDGEGVVGDADGGDSASVAGSTFSAGTATTSAGAAHAAAAKAGLTEEDEDLVARIFAARRKMTGAPGIPGSAGSAGAGAGGGSGSSAAGSSGGGLFASLVGADMSAGLGSSSSSSIGGRSSSSGAGAGAGAAAPAAAARSSASVAGGGGTKPRLYNLHGDDDDADADADTDTHSGVGARGGAGVGAGIAGRGASASAAAVGRSGGPDTAAGASAAPPSGGIYTEAASAAAVPPAKEAPASALAPSARAAGLSSAVLAPRLARPAAAGAKAATAGPAAAPAPAAAAGLASVAPAVAADGPAAKRRRVDDGDGDDAAEPSAAQAGGRSARGPGPTVASTTATISAAAPVKGLSSLVGYDDSDSSGDE